MLEQRAYHRCIGFRRGGRDELRGGNDGGDDRDCELHDKKRQKGQVCVLTAEGISTRVTPFIRRITSQNSLPCVGD